MPEREANAWAGAWLRFGRSGMSWRGINWHCYIGDCEPRHGYIAQWLERLTADQQVPGSNPGVPLLSLDAPSLHYICGKDRRHAQPIVHGIGPRDFKSCKCPAGG